MLSQTDLFRELGRIAGKENVLVEASAMGEYSKDMADYEAVPLVVVKPRNEDDVARVVQLAAREHIPILPRGAGTSLTGAAVLEKAIVLDMRSMAAILKVDTVNWFVRVQPGISLQDLNEELKKFGFFFPPDPASSYLCTVGGAIAEGSGGLRCVRYGTMKDWVVSVRVVLANGRRAQFGEPLAKNRAGYDLVHLMVGSEGTLGVVTEAYLKIIPLPSVPTKRLLVTFREWGSAGRAVGGLRRSKVVPSLLEFMDREVIAALNERTGSTLDEAEATMLVDVDEPRLDEATAILDSCGASSIRVAKDEEEAETLYQIRAMAFLAIKSVSSGVYAEDVTVPIDRLEEYFNDVKELARKHGLRILMSGHAGDGNVHPHVLYNKRDPRSVEVATKAVQEMCAHAVAMGGSVSGEHGIGIQKVSLFREQMLAHDGEESLRLMKEVKKVFDPEGIMNPGKYVEAA